MLGYFQKQPLREIEKITLRKYSNFPSKARNNFWKSRKFSRHLSAAEFHSSYTFAIHINFALIWNLGFYEASLQYDLMYLTWTCDSGLLLIYCIHSDHGYNKIQNLFCLMTIFLLNFQSIYCIIIDSSDSIISLLIIPVRATSKTWTRTLKNLDPEKHFYAKSCSCNNSTVKSKFWKQDQS